MPVDLLIANAREVITCAGPAPRAGAAQANAGAIADAIVAGEAGRIVFVGPPADLHSRFRVAAGAVTIDAGGGTVVPGFVDPHTHVVFAGDRRQELRRRLAGATYAEIAAEGGGIVTTVAATRAASEDDLVEATLPRLAEMLRCGTTTAEVKSGYGLTLRDERKMLVAVSRLSARQPIQLVPTFLGAHEVPPEYRARPDDYVRLVIEEMIPAIAGEHLAAWCDVFCEEGVFTPDASRRILDAGARAGMAPRIHANELGPTGGVEVACAVRARSADHLVHVGRREADQMAEAGVTATLLPAAAFYLKLGRFAPARLLVERGVPVALATDVNPGGGFTPSMPAVMTLACFGMGLTFEEALVGATVNAAWALDLADEVGSLEAGKAMDAVVVDGPAVDLLRLGADAIRLVIKQGVVVHERQARSVS